MNLDALIPYSLKSDDTIFIIILISFWALTYVFSNSRKYLAQQGRNFILHKDRATLFVPSSAFSSNFSILLVLQTCFLIAIVFFGYFNYKTPLIVQKIQPYYLVGMYTLLFLAYLFLKKGTYSFVNWIFFDENAVSSWKESLYTLIYYLGFTLFPYVLFLVYFDFDIKIMLMFGGAILIIAKILMLYKWLKFFFVNIHGLFLLILYFCALEIVPCFIFYRVLVNINSLLLLKF